MKLKLFLVAVAVCLLSPGISSAGDVDFGFQVDWNKFDGADEGDWGLGARLEAGGVVRFITSFDYYFVNAFGDEDIDNEDFDLKFWEVNANLGFNIPAGGVTPFLGGGVSIGRQSFDFGGVDNVLDDSQTELGYNLFGGVRFGDDAPVEPFIEARAVFYTGDETFNDRFVFSGGLLF
jgi:opacity protein-like surface antigen